ncbi:helix-turn-helix transcriptional regulator [Nitrosococcus wardiae]|uniref:AlpA family phage regulatory protein n=1 Tax=Nitrosococcus wardiae TaxID=1814290 RepID=A0A4V1AWD2_9GAMM|nr:helix-turn-helix domain-containing protein [Nitrosococcus wardiae]QBQ56225.1 AlpA family phage regulatory protein [Nitrosococcus wardiae]
MPSVDPLKIRRIGQTCKCLGVSRSTLWRWVQAGKFPQPIELTPGGAKGFRESDIEAWLDGRAKGE